MQLEDGDSADADPRQMERNDDWLCEAIISPVLELILIYPDRDFDGIYAHLILCEKCRRRVQALRRERGMS